MPTLEPRPFALALLVSGLLLSGCTDKEAADRAAADTELDRLSRSLRLVSSSAVADGDAAAQLSRIAGDASRVGGTPAQKESAQRIAAAAHRHLAELELARGLEAAASASAARSAAVEQIRAAARISDLAGLVVVDEADAEELVAMAATAMRGAMRQAASNLAELDGPIADLQSLNASDLEQAGRLNRQANDLRAEARTAGYAAGLDRYREAIDLERQAAEVEFRVASRQNELTNQLEPASRLQQAEIAGYQSAIERLENSIAAIGDRVGRLDQAGIAMRAAVAGLRGTVERMLAEADPSIAGEHFEAARGHAEAAATAAGRAGRSNQDSVARADLLRGRALAMMAAEHRAHASVLRQAADVAALGLSASAAQSLEQKAVEAATAAEAALAEVEAKASGSADLAALAGIAERTRASLGG
jgi:hypothetical protein